jgi:uncharacterized protein (TIGR03435 family)
MRRRTLLATALMLSSVCAKPQFAQQPSFEVVSVKAAPSFSKTSQTTFDPGRLAAFGVNLKQLIEWAYQVTDAQVAGGPSWMDAKFFDVEAKTDGEHSRDELLHMLQPVLAERFKLVMHRESKEMPVYVLAAGTNRSELHEAKGGPSNIQIQGLPGGGTRIALQIIGQSVSMQYLTSYLTGILDRLVIDRTGFKTSFDFKVDSAVEESDLTNGKRSAVSNALLDAIPRLGMKLDSRKETVEILVVDQAQEPSAN